MKLQLSFLLLFLSQLNGFTQDTGVVKFYVDTDNGYFEIELNDSILLKRYKDTLEVGVYRAKVWSPGYQVNEFDFEVLKDELTNCEVKMVRSEAYKQYESDYSIYRKQFHKQFTLPLSTSIVTTITSGFFMLKGYDLKKTVLEDVDLYQQAAQVKDVDDIKLRIASNNKKYDRMRTAFYISSGASILCIGGTIFSAIHFKKNYKEPEFRKESPFKERFSLDFGLNSFNLTYQL